MYTYHEELPDPLKYNELRELAGWGSLDFQVVRRSLPNSQYSVCAKYNDAVIAFARVVGDGGLSFYIQEIIVHPDHQGNGIATQFMDYILRYIDKNAVKGGYIGVFVGKYLEEFYERFGFWKRPTKEMGPGMMQFWNNPEMNDHFKGK